MSGAYILLKYLEHEIYDEDYYRVKLDISYKSKIKYMYILIRRYTLDKAFEKRSFNVKSSNDIELFFSSVVQLEHFSEEEIDSDFSNYKNMNVFVSGEPAIIPVYKNTTIPIESPNEARLVGDILKIKDSRKKLLIKRVAHLDTEASKKFGNYIPDFILTNTTNGINYICEVFGVTEEGYLHTMIEKVDYYTTNEKILSSGYRFVGYFDNLTELCTEELKWARPYHHTLVTKEWEYTFNLSAKVKYTVTTILKNKYIDNKEVTE